MNNFHDQVTTSSNSEDMSLEDSEVEFVMNKTQNMQVMVY
jgi:hypothetical protein